MTSQTSTASACTRSGPRGRREIVRQFTPNGFPATMGTGITALAIATALWWIDTAMSIVCGVVSLS